MIMRLRNLHMTRPEVLEICFKKTRVKGSDVRLELKTEETNQAYSSYHSTTISTSSELSQYPVPFLNF